MMERSNTVEAQAELVDFVDEAASDLASALTWTVLIVDDDEDVHVATTLTLRGLLIEGRPLALLHAHSAKEAHDIIKSRTDIAVTLLDVVMETDDAGLRLVSQIREQLGRAAMRIILRTGQPGHAPEIETIRRHDINDYRTKADMTQVRLFTSLTSAVRAYRQLHAMEQARHGLENIVDTGRDLGRTRSHAHYVNAALVQLGALLGLPDFDAICVRAGTDEEPSSVVAATGRHAELLGQRLDGLPLEPHRQALVDGLQHRRCSFDAITTLCFPSSSGRPLVAVADARPLDALEQRLVEMFCAYMGVALDNVLLYNRLSDLAYQDPLLKLPNRNRLVEILDEHLAQGRAGTLALVDLDDFAGVNEAFGHLFGDHLLQVVGERLARVAGPKATAARLSSDTFALLGTDDRVAPATMRALFEQPFVVGDELLRLSATSGLVRLTDGSRSGTELLKDAHIALKHAKARHRGGAWYFSRSMAQDAAERMRLLRGLREAFDQERLFLAYQPQVDLSSGRVVGAEALIRWRTEDGRFVPPDRFVPIAEQSGLIVTIGEFVLRTACHQLKRLQQLGHADFRMSVNVSQVQFRSPGFSTQVSRAMRDCEVEPRFVELEITESMAAEDFEFMMGVLGEIKKTGVSVAIDDFGTGFSSLSVLRQLGADRLKIDRAFVNEVDPAVDGSGTIARTVVELGRNLSMAVIAEGVETEGQRDALAAMGCHEGQGYLFARPMGSEALEDWLAK